MDADFRLRIFERQYRRVKSNPPRQLPRGVPKLWVFDILKLQDIDLSRFSGPLTEQEILLGILPYYKR